MNPDEMYYLNGPDEFVNPNESEWISVEDKLPEVNVIVQVWREKWSLAKRVDVGGTDLWHFDGEYLYTYYAPTHWMPLPKPPQT